MPSRLEKCRIQFHSVLGHGGSVVFQSLFDGHPEVLMFPAPLGFYHTFFDDTNLEGRWERELREHLDHQYYVSPSVSGLGPQGDERLPNLSSAIVASTRKFLAGEPFSRRRLFFAFYEAVAEVYAKDLASVRLIWCHEHDLLALLQVGLPAAKADGLEFGLVVNTRDPRSQWLSVRNSIRRELEKDSKGELLGPGRNQVYTRCYQFMVSAVENLEKTPFSYDLVRLEELQRYRFDCAREFAAKLGLSPHPSLESTTFLGKRFTGSWYSRAADGISTTALWENWSPNFVGWEATVVEQALAPEIAALGYAPPWATRGAWWHRLLLPLAFREPRELRASRWRHADGISGKTRVGLREVKDVILHGLRLIRAQWKRRHYSRVPTVSPVSKPQ